MVKIDSFDFNQDSINNYIRGLRHWGQDVGDNWPVVYILNNNEEAYVGETVNVATRFEQHLQNPDRRRLTDARVVTDSNFNKSVILDLESFLIKYMSADGKYCLQNGNGGLTDHAYYQMEDYEKTFYSIWEELRKLKIVECTISEIENSAIYKYSPYKSLGKEQIEVEKSILNIFQQISDSNKHAAIVINGGAGTGKTILAIYLMKLISDVIMHNTRDYDLEYDDVLSIAADEAFRDIKKIGIVFPQKSLQTSIKDVFNSISGLDSSMVMSPSEVVKNYIKTGQKYDLLIVDEAHRLKYREKGTLTNYKSYELYNKELGLDLKLGNELDWIINCSSNQILFRDELQTIRPCDIRKEVFDKRINSNKEVIVFKQALETQWRCEGGNEYIEYVRNILSGRQKKRKTFKNYDFILYDDCNQMIEEIRNLNSKYGLCRTVAGYAWPWDRKNTKPCTIHIQGHNYRWNSTYDNWIGKEELAKEIGCIHTVQGYDLNYTGVIIGNDLCYDSKANRLFSVSKNYYDKKGKTTITKDPNALCEYICNIYLTLMTRGIKGTFVYVCDEELKEYFKHFLPIQ